MAATHATLLQAEQLFVIKVGRLPLCLHLFCLAQVYSFPENIIKYKVWMLRKLY